MRGMIFAPEAAKLLPAMTITHGDVSTQVFDTEDVDILRARLSFRYELLFLMDQFLLVLPIGDDLGRQKVLDVFFEQIAPQYEQAVQTERNRENVRLLEQMLELSAPGVVLDFGCGPGLTFNELTERGHRVVGVDSCPVMRRMAGANGAPVYSPEEFASSGIVVDGIIASYVLHFEPSIESLGMCWSHLRSQRVLVGNIHKGIGLESCTQRLAALGGLVSHLGIRSGAERHGYYVGARKN